MKWSDTLKSIKLRPYGWFGVHFSLSALLLHGSMFASLSIFLERLLYMTGLYPIPVTDLDSSFDSKNDTNRSIHSHNAVKPTSRVTISCEWSTHPTCNYPFKL
jgi:hypothetical protein